MENGALPRAMSPPSADEIESARAALGVTGDASADAIKKAYLQKSFALIQRGAPEAERTRLRAAFETLAAQTGAAERQQQVEILTQGRATREETELAAALAAAEQEERAREPALNAWDPRSFDSWHVNALFVPLVAVLAILFSQSPLGFLLQGFHVWMHEFGHATVAWLSGHRALPLPIGWAAIDPERSNFVYGGVLFLLVVLFIAGAKEKKIMPMLASVVLAFAQFVMTWRWSQDTGYKWSVFAGVGGQFYLSAAMMGLFYFRLPQKFRWGACRYFFLFIGASSFFQAWSLWRRIKRGEEGIPYGSMIGGEEDAGGDMNILHDDYQWTQHTIIATYNRLADVCLVALAVLYAAFALRLDRPVTRLLRRHS